MNRLDTATESSGGFDRDYDYDAFGNRWVDSSTGLAYSGVYEPAYETNFDKDTNRIQVGDADFDAAGNQIHFAHYDLTFDAENRITSAISTEVDDEAYFAYDGDGRRVGKSWDPDGAGPEVVTYYIFDIAGRLAAEYSDASLPSQETSYVFTDLLGSVRMVTDESGNVDECYDYLPFGRMLSAPDNGRSTPGCFPPTPSGYTSDLGEKFTGQQRDEILIDYFIARYYADGQGRFLSTDPSRLSAFFSDPQSWNRYTYGYNNPLTFVDRNGAWPTRHHNTIIETAFRGLLPEDQITLLQEVSRAQDSLRSMWDTSTNYRHALSAPNQSVREARRLYEDFVGETLSEAGRIQREFWEQGNSGFSDDALRQFGIALHAIQDSTSPAHAGFQLYNINPRRMAMHILGEAYMSTENLDIAVRESVDAFNGTFLGVERYDPFRVLEWLNAYADATRPAPPGDVSVCVREWEGGPCLQ